MQRSPLRKSTRLQTASHNATEEITQQPITQSVPTQPTSVSTRTTTTTGVAEAAIIELQPLNTNEAQQTLPPLMPGPSVRFQPSQSTSAANISTDME